MIDTRKWCWSTDDCGENPDGPYDTREFALEMAGDEMKPGDTIWIGRCADIFPKDHVPVDLVDVLERMEEHVCDGCSGDGDIFDCDNMKDAQTALKWAMQVWADEWISCCHWKVEGLEEVIL